MKLQSTCPACNGKLTFWTGLRAPTPFTIQCPKCKIKLKTVLPHLGLIFAAIFLFFVLLDAEAIVLFVLNRISFRQFLAANGCLLFLWLLVEIVLGVLLFNHAKFVPKKPKTP